MNQLREITRKLERKLELLNASDCTICNINTAQCHILVEVGRGENLSLKEVAAIVDLDKSTVCKAVDDMVQKNMIHRTQNSSDRRRIELNLTDQGMDLYSQVEKDMNEKFDLIFNRIPEEEQKKLLASLEIFLAAMEETV